MFKKITSKLDIHTLEVLIKSSKTMIVKIIGMIAGLSVSIFLGRMLGPEGLGIVSFANKFGMILLILTMFGFQNVIIKFIAIAKAKQDNKAVASILKTSVIFNGLLSLVIASIGASVLSYVLDFWSINQDLHIPLLIVFFMLIPQTISRVYGAALNGYGKIWQSNLVNQTLTLILVGLGLLLLFILKIPPTPVNVLLLYALSRVLLLLIILALWRKTFKSKIKALINLKPMLKMAKHILLITGAGVIANNADIMMLTALGTFSDVGIYTVAAQLSILTSLFLHVSNAAISPKLATLFHESKSNEMQLMVKSVTKGLTLVALVFVISFIFLGQWLLSFWGHEFQESYLILVILAIGQFFNISTGCSGLLLVMCGFEKIHGYISLCGLALNITLNLILIIKFGALGAAIATAITILIENITKVIFAKQKIGILTLPV